MLTASTKGAGEGTLICEPEALFGDVSALIKRFSFQKE
jgi:hypothetical protein